MATNLTTHRRALTVAAKSEERGGGNADLKQYQAIDEVSAKC